MKASEADILMIPGRGGAGENHWMSRWAAKIASARIVEGIDWLKPDRFVWVERIVAEARLAKRPVVLVAHSLGVAAAMQAVHEMHAGIAGGFFVAPPDLTPSETLAPEFVDFAPYPAVKLGFPAITIASRNDPACSYERAEELAAEWNTLLIDAGESGRIDEASGHGPWPEGSMVFAHYLSRLQV